MAHSKHSQHHKMPDYHGHDLIPIHVSNQEVKYFNYMQGGQFIDKDTGLREYSKLRPIIRIPEIRNLFIEMADAVYHHKKLPPGDESLIKQLEETQNLDIYFEPIPSDEEPEIKQLEALANNPEDKRIVLMPSDIVNFMDILKGGPDTDPIAHLEEFGLFNEILRGVATVAGAVLGGPVGAIAGNFLGKVGTGANPSDNILPAVKAGLGTWGLGQGVAALGSAMPGLASAMPSVFGAGATAGATPAIVGAAAKGASGPASWLSSLTPSSSWLAPAALIGGGMYMTHRGEKEKAKQLERMEEKRRHEAERLREKYGFNDRLGVEIKKHVHYPEPEKFDKPMAFASGGHVPKLGRPIVGKGKGQEDLINDDRVKEGGWIWDASTVANVGDGSTKAGQEEIKKLEQYIVKKSPPLKHFQKLDHGGQPKMVPCALSDGERYTPPEIVTAAGNGSNTQGAAINRAITKFIRRHKISKGTDLPPASPDLISLYKKVS